MSERDLADPSAGQPGRLGDLSVSPAVGDQIADELVALGFEVSGDGVVIADLRGQGAQSADARIGAHARAAARPNLQLLRGQVRDALADHVVGDLAVLPDPPDRRGDVSVGVEQLAAAPV